MVFITGPRQVGKTWIAKQSIDGFKNTIYLNYDNYDDRKIITDKSWLPDTEYLILDELHKMPDWKTFIKGVYDTRNENLKIIVTGSARLDAFKQTGESLAGRYFRHRLMPITPSELKQTGQTVDIDRLLEYGGFPEPYLSIKPDDAMRWRQQYIEGLIRDDILDFERIHDIRAIKLMLDLLRRRAGSPISYSSIAEDVHISPNSVKKYIEILEALFIIFRITPWSKNIARSLIKEPKIYFFDTGLIIGDDGIRFENLAAVSLYKHACGITDYLGRETSLQYIRTKDGKEVDFCLVDQDGPITMIECKFSDSKPSPNLVYFHDRFSIKGVQLVYNLRHPKLDRGIEIHSAKEYLGNLEF